MLDVIARLGAFEAIDGKPSVNPFFSWFIGLHGFGRAEYFPPIVWLHCVVYSMSGLCVTWPDSNERLFATTNQVLVWKRQRVPHR